MCFSDAVEEREADVVDNGIAAYTTAVGWLGYDDDKIRLQIIYHFPIK